MNVLKLATAAAAVATLALAATPSLAATTWDAVADFSSTQSTVVNGVWSYGWDAGTGFQAYTTNTACGTGLSCWNTPDGNFEYGVPTVIKNTTAGQVDYGTVRHPNNVLNVHPGAVQPAMNVSIDSIVRFTAPTAGSYNFSGFFQVLDISPSGVSILAGGAPVVLSLTLFDTATFNGVASLAAGGNIDFRVNRAGAIWNDSTGLAATVTAVPEPATWAMMIMGFGAAGMMMRRQRGETTYRLEEAIAEDRVLTEEFFAPDDHSAINRVSGVVSGAFKLWRGDVLVRG